MGFNKSAPKGPEDLKKHEESGQPPFPSASSPPYPFSLFPIEDEAGNIHQDPHLTSQPRSGDIIEQRDLADGEMGGRKESMADTFDSFWSVPSSLAAGEDVAVKRRWDNDLAWVQTRQLNAHFDSLDKKIHRFPAILRPLRQQYGTPKNVPVGPYHVVLQGITMVGELKDVATHHFLLDTHFGSFEDMYEDFCSKVEVRSFCYEHVPYDDDSLMFSILRDGCFLLQYMDISTSNTGHHRMPPALVSFFLANQVVIDRDIMLLENQVPWVVIETLRRYKRVQVNAEEFAAKMARTLQQVRKGNDDKSLDSDGRRHYKPPHLLGLVRFHKIGRSNIVDNKQDKRTTAICKSTSLIELAEIGIKLTVSETTDFVDMGIKKRFFCTEIFLPQLLLDETRLCWLINMVAFELATYRSNTTTDNNDDISRYQHVVSSYILVLAMLMDREEDVHKLRSKGLIQGELTNKEILNSFKGLVKHISGGRLYLNLMKEIEEYKLKRWMWIKLHKFFYKNYKTIAAVLSIIGVLVGIFKALFSMKKN